MRRARLVIAGIRRRPAIRNNGRLPSMKAKLAWFLLGALSASAFWVIVAIGLNERLMQVFYGFSGH